MEYVIVRKDGSVESHIVENNKSKDECGVMYEIEHQIGAESAELARVPQHKGVYVVYDDFYGWDKTDEDFMHDRNYVASCLTSCDEYNDVAVVRVSDECFGCDGLDSCNYVMHSITMKEVKEIINAKAYF